MITRLNIQYAQKGFFAYGEYFTHPRGKCLLFSQTMTVLTLAELDQPDTPALTNELKPLITAEESKQLKTLRVLHRRAHKLLCVKG